MGNEEIIDIRCKLENELAKRFLQIKKALGLTKNTEVFRAVLNDYWDKHFKEGPDV